MSESVICPIKVGRKAESWECNERCALWYDEEHCCAILSIAKNLDRLERSVSKIQHEGFRTF